MQIPVFENGVYVASFEPDAHDFLPICQNPGELDEEVLHMLADEIEIHHRTTSLKTLDN